MMSRAGVPVAIAVLATFRPAAAAPLAIHIHSEHAMFQVLVSPGTVGTDSFVLQLMAGDGNLLRVNEATLVLNLPGRGIEPLHRKATLGADGYWHVDDVPVPSSGRWHLRIDALTDFRKITLEGDSRCRRRENPEGFFIRAARCGLIAPYSRPQCRPQGTLG